VSRRARITSIVVQLAVIAGGIACGTWIFDAVTG
jgi:hypothetical protein